MGPPDRGASVLLGVGIVPRGGCGRGRGMWKDTQVCSRCGGARPHSAARTQPPCPEDRDPWRGHSPLPRGQGPLEGLGSWARVTDMRQVWLEGTQDSPN